MTTNPMSLTESIIVMEPVPIRFGEGATQEIGYELRHQAGWEHGLRNESSDEVKILVMDVGIESGESQAPILSGFESEFRQGATPSCP